MNNVLACVALCLVVVAACDSNPTTAPSDAAADRGTAAQDVHTVDVNVPATDVARDTSIAQTDTAVVPTDARPVSGCLMTDGDSCQEFSTATSLCPIGTFVAMCPRTNVSGVCEVPRSDGGTLNETQYYYSPFISETVGRALCASFEGTFRTAP